MTKCPECGFPLKGVLVKVRGAKSRASSRQCPKCGYFEFEQASSLKVLEELRETPLKIEQKIVKLSGQRLGIYLNRHVVRSLNLRKGEYVSVSVPDRKHILIELEG